MKYPAVIAAPVVLAIANSDPGVTALKLTMIYSPRDRFTMDQKDNSGLLDKIRVAVPVKQGWEKLFQQSDNNDSSEALLRGDDNFSDDYYNLETGDMMNSSKSMLPSIKLNSMPRKKACILGLAALCGTGITLEHLLLSQSPGTMGPSGTAGGMQGSGPHFNNDNLVDTTTYNRRGLRRDGGGSDAAQGGSGLRYDFGREAEIFAESMRVKKEDESLGELYARRKELQDKVANKVKDMNDADRGEASGDMVKERLDKLRAERDNLKYSVALKVRAMDDADAKERKALGVSHSRVVRGTRNLLSGHSGHHGGHAHYAHAYGMWASTHHSFQDENGVQHIIDIGIGHGVPYGEPPTEECGRDHYMRTLSYFRNAKVHDYLWDDVCSPIYYNPYVPERDDIMINWGRENDWSQAEFNIIQILAGTTIANEINLVPTEYHQDPNQLRKDIKNEDHPLHDLMVELPSSGDSEYYTLKNYERGSFVHKFTRKQTGQLLFYIMSKGGVFEFTLRDVGRLGFQLGPFSSESASVYKSSPNINNNSLSSMSKYLVEGLKICDDGWKCPEDFRLNPNNEKKHFNFELVYDVLELSVTRHSIFQLENSHLKDAFGHPSRIGSVPLMDGGYYPEQAIEGSITYEEVKFLRDYFQAMESIEPVERPGPEPDSGNSPDLIKGMSMINGQPTLRGLVY